MSKSDVALAYLATMADDPVLFANTLLPKKPHPGQVTWLRNSTEYINTLTPGNRFGKSTIIAEKHIFKCVFKHGLPKMAPAQWRAAQYHTISAAHSADQALIVFNDASAMCSTPEMKPFVKSIRVSPFPHINFNNGSVLHCRSAHDGGKYIDGHAYRYVSIDEAGYIDNLKTLMNGVILLRLAGGGEIDLVGTPKGYNDLFFYFERGRRKVPGYYSQRGSIFDNPFLPSEDLAMRDALLTSADPVLREQALFGAFVDTAGLAFTTDQLDQLFVIDMPAHTPWKEGHRYVAGWDLGRQTDFTVGFVIDITKRPWQVVHYERLNKVAWEEIYERIRSVGLEYHVRQPSIDATGPAGDVIEEELYKRGIFVDGVKVSTHNLKVELINGMQHCFDEGRKAVSMREAVDEGGFQTVHPVLERPDEGSWGALRMPPFTNVMDELGVYCFDDKKLKTDCVFGLGLAIKAAYEAEAVAAPVVGGLYS